MGRFSRLGPSAERARGYAAVVAFGVVYLVAVRVSIAWFGSVGVPGFSGPIVWPATGVYVGGLLVAPRRLWPHLACLTLAASLIAHIDAGGSFAVSLGFAVPNAAEGLFVALLVRRGAADRCTLADPRDLGALLGGALVGQAFFALSAAAVAAYGTSSPFAGSWVRWWISGGLGILLVAPVIALPLVRLNRASSREKAQITFVAAGIGAAAVIAAAVHPWDAAGVIALAVALPFSFWAGWRWGVRATALCVLAVAAVTAYRGAHDGGLFADGGAASVHVLAVQAAIAVVAVASLLASSVAARHRSMAAQNSLLTHAFGEASDKLRRLLRSTTDAWVSVDEHGSITAWNRQAEKTFGWLANDAVGMDLDETLVASSAVDSWAAALTAPTDGLVQLTARHRSGNELQVELTIAHIGEDGSADLWIRDVTERERLRRQTERLSGELAATAAELAHAAEKQEGLERDLRATIELRDQALEDGGRERERLEEKVGALEDELRQAREVTAELEREIELARERQRDADEELATTKERVAEVERAVAEAGQRHAEVAAELEQALQRQSETDAELEHERHNLAETATELERTRQNEAELTAELDEARQRQRDADEELAAAKERLAEVERAVEEAGQRLAETAAQLDQARQRQAETEAELERERHGRAETTTDLERTRQSEAELTAALDQARRRHAETAAELQRARAAHREAAAELERASARIAELENALRTASESQAGVEAERSQLSAETERLAAELANLRQTRESAERALREAQRASAVQEHRWIAEQRRLESALNAATETLANADPNGTPAEESGADVIARYDDRGICTYASPSWRDAFGWEQEDLIGRQGNEFLHRDDRHLVLNARTQTNESHFHARIRNKQGEFTRVETTFRPIRDHDEKLIGIDTTLRPVPADVAIASEANVRHLFG